MTVNLKIPGIPKPVRLQLKLDKDVVDTLNLYVEAASEQNDGCDVNLIVSTILTQHFKRDKSFNKWRIAKNKQQPVVARSTSSTVP